MEKVEIKLNALLEVRENLDKMILDSDTKIVSAIKQSVIKEISQKLDSDIKTLLKHEGDDHDIRRPDTPKRMRLV